MRWRADLVTVIICVQWCHAVSGNVSSSVEEGSCPAAASECAEELVKTETWSRWLEMIEAGKTSSDLCSGWRCYEENLNADFSPFKNIRYEEHRDILSIFGP